MATPLLAIRKARKVPLRELGEAVNLTKGQLSRIERGESRPSAKTVERLFTYFGGSISREELMFPDQPVLVKRPVQSVGREEI